MSTQTQDAAESSEVGELVAIWIKPVHRGPMLPRQSAQLTNGGLEGNVHRRGRRRLTLLDADAWARAEADLGQTVDPVNRRANLMLRGLDLEGSRGRVLCLGTCRIEILGETRPCRLMDDAAPGLERALGPEWRGGVFGRALDDGEIALGDPAAFVAGQARLRGSVRD
ncbi:MAG: MOSC domain-containing protein [Acidobacteriota bacterium]